MTDDETLDRKAFDVGSDTGIWMNVGPVTRPDGYTFGSPLPPSPAGFLDLNPGAVGQPEETRAARREEFAVILDRAMADKVAQYERVIEEAMRNRATPDPWETADFSQLAPPMHWLYRLALLAFALLAVLLVSCWYFSRTG